MSYKVFLNYGIQVFRNKKSFLKSFSESVVYRALVVGINFITGIWISRGLMEAGRGQFSLFVTALTIANVLLNFGFNGSAVYYAKKDPDKIKQYLSANFILTGISLIFIILFLLFFETIFKFQSDTLRIVFIICYAIYSFSNIIRCFLIGLDQNVFLFRLDFYTRSIYFLFILYMFYFKKISVLNICIFLTLEYLAFTLIAYRKIGISIIPLSWNRTFIRETLLFNLKNYLGGVLFILVLRGDQFIIKYFNGNFSVGVYSTASTIIENMMMFMGVLTVLVLPKLLEESDFNQLLRKTKTHLFTIVSINLLLTIAIYFLSPILYYIYFKKTNPEGVETLRILLIGFNTWAVFIYLYNVYLSIRLKKSIIFILGIGFLLNVILNFTLIPKIGIKGAAWASSISYSAICVLTIIDLYYFKKKNHLNRIAKNED